MEAKALETTKPRATKPRDHETARPRDHETTKPRDHETTRPQHRDRETAKQPRNPPTNNILAHHPCLPSGGSPFCRFSSAWSRRFIADARQEAIAILWSARPKRRSSPISASTPPILPATRPR